MAAVDGGDLGGWAPAARADLGGWAPAARADLGGWAAVDGFFFSLFGGCLGAVLGAV